MKYYISRNITGTFEDAIGRVTEGLKAEGFGILSDIDVSQTMKAKIGVDFRPYRILGACNPSLAHRALSMEDKIGVMLPCNVIVQQHENGAVEVAAIDPAVSMESIGNPALTELATLVREKLERVVSGL
ncbi:conserved hypothetical protein [Methylocella tundrae]|uniref:DUF302 domain-containing protein n=1 Tax=Methylocella tundrae TaxID=227605 RepID=A0A4U8Z786_METTU|nr:DUF302 domain-containing protein [Methylocella tundrae]WPP03010.1 DUF302 domain-containing protein [Methylocella tundrae]VFU16749.1 conserved protein of unknown function [Methylocella tundrae]VTZ27835.1 conserved hypothetical protein [Methylocella tundrae]VTZ50707.1 conserved hypothetical protein [Methylocella tundrae]